MYARTFAALLAAAGLGLPAAPLAAGPFDCSVVYDEFDSLMNKNFLLKPESYVRVVKNKLSRADYNAKQKGKLLLRPARQGLGVAIVQTNRNTWGKFLYTYGGRRDTRGTPLLILRDVTLFGRVQDGNAPRITREIRVIAAQRIDLDRGLAGEGPETDIWFRNVDSKTMTIEAVNGAKLSFPMETLCR
ncbi:MAG: hypothetical protein ACR2PO_10550 [Methyloligellaceae bacterium]